MVILADRLIIRPDQDPIDKGAIVVERGMVRAVGPAEKILNRFPHHRRIAFERGVVLPGLVNAHTHLELPPLRNRSRAKDYAAWVLALLRARSTLTRADHVRAAARNVGMLLRTGTTAVGEICSYNASPDVIRRSGIRATIFHEIISLRPGDRLPALPPLSLRSTRLVRHGLSPHSPHTTSEEVIAFLTRRSRKHGIPLCMHVAETRGETDLLRRVPGILDRIYAAARWDRAWAPRGRTPFQYLARAGILNSRFLAVHAVHTDAQDLSLIKRTGTAVAHCPRSNHALHVGTMPLRQFMDKGITIGLGTDSLASVSSLNLWDEMRFALRTHRRDGVTARQLLQLATMGGAKALGLGRAIGELVPGREADLIVVPFPRRFTGDLCSDLLRETKSCTMTMVNGKVLYRADEPRN